MKDYVKKNDLIKIAQIYYKGRDKSHGIDHVMAVYNNSLKIIKGTNISERYKSIVLAAALLHDTYDHKYVKESEIYKVINKIKKDLISIGFKEKDCSLVIKIIDNISYSKEKKIRLKGKKIELGSLQKYRNIVSDADKIEALGTDGVVRMIHYLCHKNPKATMEDHIKHIRDHCDEKLYILIKKRYIRTRPGRELANKKLQKLKAVVDNDKILKKYITKHSKKACKN